ncbi:cleavage stimulation factor subunit 2 isoform X7 [Scyliorhinus torazame]|uniref:cleavage stimulation factor subunit 2 isoform X7 n=1 Tax=Scyliorhinus torazame TaxID=75743 RepID=UPI003B5C0E3A
MASLVRDPAIDRSLRSVFVGNIPYEATEEQLKDIFSEVGPVLSFRLVYDRETGKPKGYGFCEYQDQETALSAMRNLNGREFNGRALRVDNAASEKNKEELKNLGTAGPVMESPYGDPVSPEDAPESISRAVASLPPEQMFELMKQMKLCIQNSPQEARNMLLQNPQLAYALLQAQVVMRIVDPEIAMKMLHRPANVTPLISSGQPAAGPNAPPVQAAPPVSQPQPMVGMHMNGAPPMMQQPMQPVVSVPGPGPVQGPGGPVPGPGPGPGPGPVGPGGNMQPQMGLPPSGPMPMDRGQVPMQDPRGNMQRGPPVVGAPIPRGLLGDAPNDPRGGTLLSVTGEVEPRGYIGPPHQGPPMHHVPSHDGRGPPPDMRNAHEPRVMQHDMRSGPMGEQRGPIGEQRGPMGEPRGPMGEPRGPMGEPRGPMGEPRGPMGEPRGPMGEPRGPMGEPRGPMGEPRGPMGEPRGPMGEPRGPMGEPRGPMGEPRGPMGEPRGPMGEPRGPMGEPRGPMGDPRGMMGDPRGPMMDQRGPPHESRGSFDPRSIPSHDPRSGPQHDPRSQPPAAQQDPRGGPYPNTHQPNAPMGTRDPRGIDSRGIDTRGQGPGQGSGPVPGPGPGPGPNQGPVSNPRGPMPGGIQVPGPGAHQIGNSVPPGPQQPVPPRQGPAHAVAGGQPGGFSPAQTQVTPQDHEKAALIMQVLQLTPEQIAMLPPEQRQSILILKEQIQKSAGAP